MDYKLKQLTDPSTFNLIVHKREHHVASTLSLFLTHKHDFLPSFFLSTVSLYLAQRLDPGSIFLRHLQLLAGSGAWSRDQRAVGGNKCSHLPVELQ